MSKKDRDSRKAKIKKVRNEAEFWLAVTVGIGGILAAAYEAFILACDKIEMVSMKKTEGKEVNEHDEETD